MFSVPASTPVLPQRYIAHYDLDSFFVSVETLLNPALRGIPVLVGGSAGRGVVAACNYEARHYGIHSAMPVRRALELCPHATCVKSNFEAYRHYSQLVTGIIANKAPLFEKASVDEFYLDLSGMDTYLDVLQWTLDLRNQIISQTKLPISAGLGANKLIAKIATDEAKPNGYFYVKPGNEYLFLAPLRISKIPGVGAATYDSLIRAGFHTIGDLQQAHPAVLHRLLGKNGTDLYEKSWGRHEGQVVPYHDSKSVSTEHTFHTNSADEGFLDKELVRLTERVCYELRKEQKTAGTVAVKIRYSNFETVSRQMSVSPTFRDDEVLTAVRHLFRKLYVRGRPCRLLGIRLSELGQEPSQGNLFVDTHRRNDLYKAMDSVKTRFGKEALQKARMVDKSDAVEDSVEEL